jgi:hypothetical protein
MTQDEVLKMARQAGAYSPTNEKDWAFEFQDLEAFAKLIAAKERERLAATAEKNGNQILAMQLRGEA